MKRRITFTFLTSASSPLGSGCRLAADESYRGAGIRAHIPTSHDPHLGIQQFAFRRVGLPHELFIGCGVDSLTVALVAVCGVKFGRKTRDEMASLYPTAEEVRISCAIVDAAAKVRDLNFKYMAEGKGATATARFGTDGITICDPNAPQVFQRIYEEPI